jgi:hypothetical protein
VPIANLVAGRFWLSPYVHIVIVISKQIKIFLILTVDCVSVGVVWRKGVALAGRQSTVAIDGL